VVPASQSANAETCCRAGGGNESPDR